MSAIPSSALPARVRGRGDWEATAQSLRRAALAVARADTPELFGDFIRQLTEDLRAAAGFLAIFEDPERRYMRSLAARFDGDDIENFSYELAGTPCADVVGRAFRYIAGGVAWLYPDAATFGPGGMDSYAAYPLTANDGTPLGLIAVMDRNPIADPELAESLMSIFAVRIAAELERRRGLEALRNSEASYRAIFEAVEDAIFVHDWQTGDVLDFNGKACEAYGYPREEMLGWGIDAFSSGTPPYTATEAQAWVERARRGEQPLFIWHRRRRDGSLRWDEVRLKAVTISGKPYVLACSRDITARKEAEDALRAREAQYRAIFDGSADSLVLWNREIRMVDVSAAFMRMYGYDPHEVIGRSFSSRLSAADVAPRIALIEQALRGRQGRLETRAVRKDGTWFDVELRYLPIIHQGEPHVLAVARDISDRRAAEARREELENQIRQAQKMEAIGQLTGGVAHDFNNILTSVIGYLGMAEERAANEGDADLVRYLDQAHLAASRARDLIAQMMAFARRQRSERQVTDLAPLVRQSVQLLRATMPASTIIDADVVASASAEVDSVQIEQVLFNLCINARDAVRSQGCIRVRLRETVAPGWHCASCRADVPPARWLELSVADDGSGINAETLDRMFDPFYSTKEMDQGSGMGLAMVHGIVHEHGGHVQVQTDPGVGSVFRVMLPPAGATPVVAEVPSSADRPPAAAQARPLSGRVLLVEDQPMVGGFMAELLGKWGLTVTLQADPVRALDWLEDRANPVDVLITDQTMPRLCGTELATRASAARPGLAVVLYTGGATELSEGDLRAAGVRSLLRKPIDPARLRGALEEVLDPPGRLPPG
ncbi:MAG: PAS domain S-box protein [Burkholderiaceae bacterium]|nr:PAS domain S-box protein [Burkholderiaceae bacterium]